MIDGRLRAIMVGHCLAIIREASDMVLRLTPDEDATFKETFRGWRETAIQTLEAMAAKEP